MMGCQRTCGVSCLKEAAHGCTSLQVENTSPFRMNEKHRFIPFLSCCCRYTLGIPHLSPRLKYWPPPADGIGQYWTVSCALYAFICSYTVPKYHLRCRNHIAGSSLWSKNGGQGGHFFGRVAATPGGWPELKSELNFLRNKHGDPSSFSIALPLRSKRCEF